MPIGVYQRKITSMIDRFWRHILPEPNSGCWLWTGALHKGYGVMGGEGKGTVRVHRFAYEYFRGPIPPGTEPDHLCRMRSCGNPWHLEAVSRRENFLRGAHWAAQAYRTNTCRRGHSLDDAYLNRQGWRDCRTCKLARIHRLSAEKRARGEETTSDIVHV